MKFKKVSMTIVCKEEDSEFLHKAFEQSNFGQLGIYGMGTSIEDCSEDEVKEVLSQVPEEIMKEYMDR